MPSRTGEYLSSLGRSRIEGSLTLDALASRLAPSPITPTTPETVGWQVLAGTIRSTHASRIIDYSLSTEEEKKDLEIIVSREFESQTPSFSLLSSSHILSLDKEPIRDFTDSLKLFILPYLAAIMSTSSSSALGLVSCDASRLPSHPFVSDFHSLSFFSQAAGNTDTARFALTAQLETRRLAVSTTR